MTAEKLYNEIKAWRESCSANGMPSIAHEMNEVLNQLEADMRLEAAKKGNTKSIVTAANRIIKNAQKENAARPLLHAMFENTLGDGTTVYCVCDGYHAVRFNEKPLLPELDSKYNGQQMNLNNIVKEVDGSGEIQLPDIAELKVYIKTHKITDKSNPKKVEDYLLNEYLGLWVNPRYLLNVMECLPGCKAWAANKKSVIYFTAENGDGCLCPVNHK